MNLIKEFAERVKHHFKPATVKKAEFFDSFARLSKELKNNLDETCVEYSTSDNTGKIIIDINSKRIVLEASSATIRDAWAMGGGEFLPFIACNGIHTTQVHNLTEAIKSGDITNARTIVTAELNRPRITSKLNAD